MAMNVSYNIYSAKKGLKFYLNKKLKQRTKC